MKTYYVYDSECNFVGSFRTSRPVRPALWARIVRRFPSAAYCVQAWESLS